MTMDLSNCCCEQAAALILVKVSWGTESFISILFSKLCRIPLPWTDICLFRSMPEHAEHSYRHWDWTWEATIWIEIRHQRSVKRWCSRWRTWYPFLFGLVPCLQLFACLMPGCC
jgi:hypothetical protein